MKNELYFTLYLTESEHWIVKEMIKDFCNSQDDLKLVYYRKFKNGHVPMYREVKINGNINKFKKFAEENHLELANDNQKVLSPYDKNKRIEKWLAKDLIRL